MNFFWKAFHFLAPVSDIPHLDVVSQLGITAVRIPGNSSSSMHAVEFGVILGMGTHLSFDCLCHALHGLAGRVFLNTSYSYPVKCLVVGRELR